MDADNTDPDESWGEDAHIPDDAAPEQDELTEEADDVTGVEEGGFDDIELAYREAMKSIDDAELQVGSALMELAEDDDPEQSSPPR